MSLDTEALQAPIAAILAAFFFGASNVAARLGLQHSNPISGTLISFVVRTIIFCLVGALAVPPAWYLRPQVAIFVAAGVLGSLVGQILLYQGIARLGASIATIVNNSQPFFAAAMGAIFLSEQVTVAVVAGMMLILSGVGLLTIERGGSQLTPRSWEKRHILLPVSSALVFAGGYVLRRHGLILMPDVLGATAVITVSGMIAMLACLPLLVRWNPLLLNRQCLPPYVLAGLLIAAAQLSLNYALHLGTVVVVVPLVNAQPLFTVLLAVTLLRRLEQASWRIYAGAALVVAGAALVNL